MREGNGRSGERVNWAVCKINGKKLIIIKKKTRQNSSYEHWARQPGRKEMFSRVGKRVRDNPIFIVRNSTNH